MDQTKVTALLNKEDFAKKVFAMKEPKDVQAAFKAEGVEVTEEEVIALGKAIATKLSGKELSDDVLEDVAGGFISVTSSDNLVGDDCNFRIW